MNHTHNTKTKITLAEALASDDPAADYELVPMSDFALTAEERKRTSALWLYLTGVEPGSKAEAVAGLEVLANPDLFIMLNAPARECVNWLRREDWGFYNLSEFTGGEEWGCTVLERAVALYKAMGRLGSQEPLKLPGVA